MFPTKLFSSNEQSSPANPGWQIQCAGLEEVVVLIESLERLGFEGAEHWPLVLALLGVLPQESGHRGTEQICSTIKRFTLTGSRFGVTDSGIGTIVGARMHEKFCTKST